MNMNNTVLFHQLLEEALERHEDGSMQGLGNVLRPYASRIALEDLEAYVDALEQNLSQHTGKILSFTDVIAQQEALKDKKVLVMLIEDMEGAIFDSMMIEQYNAIIEDAVLALLPLDYFDAESGVGFSLE